MDKIDAKLLTKLDVSDIVVLKCYGCYVEANNFNTYEFILPNGMSSTGYTILSAVVEHNKYNEMHDSAIRPVYNEYVSNSNSIGVNPKAWLGENSIHLTVYNQDDIENIVNCINYGTGEVEPTEQGKIYVGMIYGKLEEE